MKLNEFYKFERGLIMEMPKGYKDLVTKVNKDIERCYEKAKDTRWGACSPVGCLCYMDQVIALNLLKEMAEALECVKLWHVQNSNYEDTGLITTRAYAQQDIQNTKEQLTKLHNDEIKKAVEVLKKFKEWE